jgi:dihydroorotase
MRILIKAAEIFDKQSTFHRQVKNVLIQNGKIIEIGDKNYSADKTIQANGMILSTGWFDVGAFVGDPGVEYKEDLHSLAKAAATGGFTEVAILPNTQPSVQSKNEVSYITQNNDNRLVQIHVLASVTKNNKGEELTEMIDLNQAGAIGFTDGLKPVWHTDIFLKSLQYLQKFDGVLIDQPEDKHLNLFGQMHEGVNSTMLGLKGMPRIAEEVAVSKNLELLSYAGGRLHIAKISTAKTVEMIKTAKKKGLNVTCSVNSYQPLLDDSLLHDFDTNFKVNPPLREKVDQDGLLRGLKDGTIDIICSGHLPQDEESKQVEFDMADFGIINLQTFAAQLVQLNKSIEMEELIEKITTNPRKLFKMIEPSIEIEAKANLTLLDPNKEWVFSASENMSRSSNSPWLGKKLKGKVVATFNNSKTWIDA